MSHAAYAAAVLDAEPVSDLLPETALPLQDKALGIAYGLASSAAALILALLAPFSRPAARHALRARQPPGASHFGHPAPPHSGHVGDYIAWIVIGAATMGTLLALLVCA